MDAHSIKSVLIQMKKCPAMPWQTDKELSNDSYLFANTKKASSGSIVPALPQFEEMFSFEHLLFIIEIETTAMGGGQEYM
jgi:hypothetical protein